MILVLACVAMAALLVWLLLEFTNRAFGDLTVSPSSEREFSPGNTSSGLGSEASIFGSETATAPIPAPAPNPPFAPSPPPAPNPSFAPSPPPAAALPPPLPPAPVHQTGAGDAAEELDVAGTDATAISPARRHSEPVQSVARRRAAMVGSRARGAILGPSMTAYEMAAEARRAGEEPAPGEVVVLVGDDVEAWVRERLYGARLPDR